MDANTKKNAWDIVNMINELDRAKLLTEWTFEPVGKLDSASEELVSKIKRIYPNVVLFRDTTNYTNKALSKTVFGIGESYAVSTNEFLKCEVDYKKSKNLISMKGKWSETIEGALENTWQEIQRAMLVRLSK